MRAHLLRGCPHRGHRHILDLMSPDPSFDTPQQIVRRGEAAYKESNFEVGTDKLSRPAGSRGSFWQFCLELTQIATPCRRRHRSKPEARDVWVQELPLP